LRVGNRKAEPFADIAAKAEIKPTDLAAIERGEIRPTGKEPQSLLAALKIGPVDFVGDLLLQL
jgi:ribosome-binding protein aMBF1 (putative translation factor)